MTLVERINLMKGKVDRLKVAKSGISDSSLFQARLEELRKISEPLKREVETLVLFNSEKFNLTKIPSSIGNAVLRITSIRERFETERNAAQLTKGRDWKLMGEYVGETIHEIGEDIRNIWRNYVEQAYSGESPAELSRILAPTNINKDALCRYENAYQKLSHRSQIIPTAREDFDQVKALADELRTIHGEFDFAVPQEVKEFLVAVGSMGGADLELLNSKVLKWLRTNGSIDSYKIVAKR